MKNIIKGILFMTAFILFFSKGHAQSPANDEKKSNPPTVNDRTPRKNTDLPPIKESNKKDQPAVNEQKKTNHPDTTDRTPRTFNDQPPIKEVPTNYPPANTKNNHPKQRKHKHGPHTPAQNKGTQAKQNQ